MEVVHLQYRLGDGMPDLCKFHGGGGGGVGNDSTTPSRVVEIHIPPEAMTNTNHKVRANQLWGTDIYTGDSDIVAAIMHSGYYAPTSTPLPPFVAEVVATVRVLPPQEGYAPSFRNFMRSRAWGPLRGGCSYSIERCRVVKKNGRSVELEPTLRRTPLVAQTLAPAALERTVTTRSASQNAYRHHQHVQEVTVQYNMSNEPWLKYSMSVVADRGLKPSQYASARVKRGDVLYVETRTARYELSFRGEHAACNGLTTAAGGTGGATVQPHVGGNGSLAGGGGAGATASGRISGSADGGHGHHAQVGSDGENYYRWARCKQPLPVAIMRMKGIPLPLDCVHVEDDFLLWEELRWSTLGVWVRGKEYILVRAHFVPKTNDNF